MIIDCHYSPLHCSFIVRLLDRQTDNFQYIRIPATNEGASTHLNNDQIEDLVLFLLQQLGYEEKEVTE